MATGNRKGTGIGHLLSRILITLVLIGVLCGCFCGIAFAMYVHIYINPSAQETAAEISKGLGLNLNSLPVPIFFRQLTADVIGTLIALYHSTLQIPNIFYTAFRIDRIFVGILKASPTK